MNKKWMLPLIFSLFLLIGCQSEDDKKYEALLQDGMYALEKESYDDAIDIFKKALGLKPNDKKTLDLLLKAQEGKTLAKGNEQVTYTPIDENAVSNRDFIIEEKDHKFYINGVTLLMSKEEIIENWGEPDSIEKPSPEDEYYQSDYDNWLFLNYGDFKLTVYSNQLRVVDLRTKEFVFKEDWYLALALQKPDIEGENFHSFTTEEQYMNFNEDEPWMQWAEDNPQYTTESSSVVDNHLSGQSPGEFFTSLANKTGYKIPLSAFELIPDYKDPSKSVGYMYKLTDEINLDYDGSDQLENVGVSHFSGGEPSREFLYLLNELIITASSVQPEIIIKQLDRNMVKSENGLANSSVVYQDGLVYKYLENALGHFFTIYVEGYEEL
ncbi:hypothetical protein ACFSO7_02495 [Bacillus sp. CGMCC 1.16607]|uniref:hypothetical protein n=1 Tax=Bacillus sp. CGMCC 1.16607 TaxID=3351842 RepID=UPI0036389B3A